MFEGSAAQFLGILEALTSSHRRTFHNAPYSNEIEMVDVTSELFIAGKEIIAGRFLRPIFHLQIAKTHFTAGYSFGLVCALTQKMTSFRKHNYALVLGLGLENTFLFKHIFGQV